LSRRGVGPAFQDVCDVNVLARETHRGDDFCQKLAGSPYERLALRVFVRSGRFADEHQVGIRIANSKNRLPSRACEMRTFQTNTDSRLNSSELIFLARIGGSALIDEGFQCPT